MTNDAGSPLWGAQTELAIGNFPIANRPLDVRVVHALALIKRHAAVVNAELGVLGEGRAEAIAAAAAQVAAGVVDDQFPLDVYQTGSGTSTNMNVNEVIASLASRAGQAVHPNDDVNASQSSNDAMPSAIRLAVATMLRDRLVVSLDALITALDGAAARFDDVVKAGRTHLMDATPVMLGDEFAAWSAMLGASRARVLDAVHRLGELPLGGTAVGTGVNCPPGFAARVIEALALETGLALRPAEGTPGRMAHMGGQGTLAIASGATRDVAIALTKVANDIRLLASGPATGIGELVLPSLQPGSSIMPGKVNPVLCESANQVAARVFGNDATVAYAASQGILELNTYLPVMADALLESTTLLSNVCSLLAERLVSGIEADIERCRRNAERTPSLATTLNTVLGYDVVAAAVKQALAEDRPVREVVLESTDADPAVVDAALDPVQMARPPE
jgi:fumarate hydratase class II